MIDFTKPIQTRDGRPAKLLEIHKADEHPVLPVYAAYKTSDEGWLISNYHSDGKYLVDSTHALDLVNVPVTRYGYLPLPDKANTYAYVDIYSSLENGDPHIEITFEDDKPVDVRILPKQIT